MRTTSAGYRLVLYDNRLLASYGLSRTASEEMGSLDRERRELGEEDRFTLGQTSEFAEEFRAYSGRANVTAATSTTNSTRPTQAGAPCPLKHVYYTESDQIVRFDSYQTLRAVIAATNQSTYFLARRREKDPFNGHPPEAYMAGLTHVRTCGVEGYSLTWSSGVQQN